MLGEIFAPRYLGDMYFPKDLNRYDITFRYVQREIRDELILKLLEHGGSSDLRIDGINSRNIH